MKFYRITFHKTMFRFAEHFEATAENANHYHVMKNNSKIGEQSKLWKAIKIIIDDSGENQELKSLMEKAHFLRKHDPYYKCVGIIYTEKYGVKIEMQFNENITTEGAL